MSASVQLDVLPPSAAANGASKPRKAEPKVAISADELAALNARFEHCSAQEIIAWGVQRLGPRIACMSSFGADSAVMLHLATRVWPQIPILALDTGFLFPETLAFAGQLADRLGLKMWWMKPALTAEQFVAEHGEMWKVNPDACCGFNKREPFLRAKRELDGWLTGIRREQSATRRGTKILSIDDEGLVKLCPIATWTAKDVHAYLAEHELPYHPLRAEGYLSIGCTHCTRRVKADEDPRAGRWSGFDKTECGLHTYTGGEGI